MSDKKKENTQLRQTKPLIVADKRPYSHYSCLGGSCSSFSSLSKSNGTTKQDDAKVQSKPVFAFI